jgi:parallel beta-helix repeat protein
MRRVLLPWCVVWTFALPALAQPDPPAAPAAGLVLTRSVKLAPGTYTVKSAGLDAPAITVRGDNISIDATGVTLVGSEDPTRPDLFQGVAIKVEGNNVSIRGLAARGYQFGVVARDAAGLTLEGLDLSYNFRQRMKSTPFKEDLGDWMFYHHNEADEWLNYGAAVYLRNCDRFVVRGLRVVGGQNGVMLTNCNDGSIERSLISFNSAIGVGLYRSSRNRVVSNRLDFNVRGHSEGVYNRGQDSAAILVYEQSHRNLFARNSATHSGDGFFLWAGQTTMDSGQGGCNDNLVYANDFSFAPTNGIEATFSRNAFVGNTLKGCWHGVWGGYSYDSRIVGNAFVDNVEAIAIEHGQANVIADNTFDGDKTAIRLWAREKQPDDWGYAKNRDTRSRDTLIADNRFRKTPAAIHARLTNGLNGFGNTFEEVASWYNLSGDTFTVRPTPTTLPSAESVVAGYDVKGADAAAIPPPLAAAPANRAAIRVTEWGPYDYRRPLVWPDFVADRTGRTAVLLGPPGRWTPAGEGFTVECDAAGRPSRAVLPADAKRGAAIAFDWVGDADAVDEFGRTIPAGTAVRVTWTWSPAPPATAPAR